MSYISQLQAAQLIEQYKAQLARTDHLSNSERVQRLEGYLTCMCHFGAIEGFQMRDIVKNYEKERSRG